MSYLPKLVRTYAYISKVSTYVHLHFLIMSDKKYNTHMHGLVFTCVCVCVCTCVVVCVLRITWSMNHTSSYCTITADEYFSLVLEEEGIRCEQLLSLHPSLPLYLNISLSFSFPPCLPPPNAHGSSVYGLVTALYR